jgi:succinate dehydrogenase/fumarate reductase flavoprotein subunit
MTQTDFLPCDLLVIGAGMAGLSAAAYAAERGAKVIVVEKSRTLGGSAALSGGVLWTATSAERLGIYGTGRPDLGAVVLRNYPVALEWLRRRGVAMGPSVSVLHGRGYQIDVLDYLRGCARLVEQHDGHVVLDSTVESLVVDDSGAVTGARVGTGDAAITVLARTTLLATGGYQNSPELRAQYIHPNARGQLLTRSNPVSDGAGLRLATAAGGYTTGRNPGFYGHLVSESPRWGDPRLYTLLTQYHSDYCLLLNEPGLRFCDESHGDHTNTNHVLAQPNARALCFWDAVIHETQATVSIVKDMETVDRMRVALEHGGHGVVAATLEDVGAFAQHEGFNGDAVCATIRDYNERSAHAWETLAPPRAENLGPLSRPPFYALIVRPAITATHGGLAIDASARVLARTGTPVPGLLAAGADCGDVYGLGYAGGLACAMAYGIESARTAGFG